MNTPDTASLRTLRAPDQGRSPCLLLLALLLLLLPTQLRAQAYPGEEPETVIHPSAIGPLMVELARGDREPALEVKFRDWSAS